MRLTAPPDAAGSVFDSAKQGASEIQSRVSDALPATSRFVSRVIYKTSYAVSFGVTLPGDDGGASCAQG